MTNKDSSPSESSDANHDGQSLEQSSQWTRREFFQSSAAALGAVIAANTIKLPKAEAHSLEEIIKDAEPGLYYRDRLPDDQTPTDTNTDTSLFDWNFPAVVTSSNSGSFGQDGMPNSFSDKTTIPANWVGTPVAIIGAGAAGLCAGYELMKLGLKPVFFEMQTEQDNAGVEYARPYGRLYSFDWGGLGKTSPSGVGWFPDTNTDLNDTTVAPNSNNTHAWGRRVAEMGGMRFPATHLTLRQYVSEFSGSTSNSSYYYGESVSSPWVPFRDPGLYKSAGTAIPNRAGATRPTDQDTLEYDTVYHTKGMFKNPFASSPDVPGTYSETYRASVGLTLDQSNDAIRNLTYKYFDLLFGDEGVLTPILEAYSAYTDTPSINNRNTIVSLWQDLIDQYDNMSLREVLAEKGWDDIPAYEDDWGAMNISLTEMFGEIGTGTGPFAMFYYSSFMELLRIALQQADSKQDYFLGGAAYLLQPFLTSPAICRTESGGLADKYLWNETRNQVITDKVVKISSSDGIVRLTTQNKQGDTQDYKFSAAILTAAPSAIRATNTFGAEEGLLPSKAFSYLKRVRINNNSKIAINFPNISDQEFSKAFWMHRSQADPYDPNSDSIVTTLTDKTIRQIYTFDNYHWRTQVTDSAVGDLTTSGTLMLNYGWDYNAQSWSAYDEETAVREAWDQMKEIYNFSFDPDPYLEWAIANKQYAVVVWEKIDGFNGAWRMAQPGRGTSIGPNEPAYQHYSEFKAAQSYGMTSYNPETEEYTGLFIAGEATASPGLSGWVEGSLQTGLQAVAGIVRYLNMSGNNNGYQAAQTNADELPTATANVASFALHAHPGVHPYGQSDDAALKP